jgi:hypothetical protein
MDLNHFFQGKKNEIRHVVRIRSGGNVLLKRKKEKDREKERDRERKKEIEREKERKKDLERKK